MRHGKGDPPKSTMRARTASSARPGGCVAGVRRVQSSYRGYPVTIYALNREDFMRDGAPGAFGGYFAGKVINPCVLFSPRIEDEAMVKRVSAQFIGPFAAAMAQRQNRGVATEANLAADSVLARFHLCPWYRSYFLRYYIHESFPQLWERMKELTASSFLEAGVVTRIGNCFRYQQVPTECWLHERTVMMAAHFWGLGSSLHGGMPDFSAYYIEKARQYIAVNNLEHSLNEMMDFLQVQASDHNEGGKNA